jgi:hypothetical protein
VRIIRIDVLPDLRGRESAAVAGQRPDGRPGVEGDASAFGAVDVGQLIADHLVAGLGVDLDRDLIGHRARRAEDRRFHAEEVREFFLQGIDGLIVAKPVVADAGMHHGVQHRRRGPRDRVAAQIDHFIHQRWENIGQPATGMVALRTCPVSDSVM